MESTGVCSRLLRVRRSLRRDPHPQGLSFDGHPVALTKTKAGLLSLGRKPFHVAGAQRFCCEVLLPVLEDEREGEELACSAQFPEQTANTEPRSWELGEWSSSALWYFQNGNLSYTCRGTLCDEEKAVEVVWEGEGDKPHTLSSPGHREKYS